MGYVGAITLASYPSPKKVPGLSSVEILRRTRARARGSSAQSIFSATVLSPVAQSVFGVFSLGASWANPMDIIVKSVVKTTAILVMICSSSTARGVFGTSFVRLLLRDRL